MVNISLTKLPFLSNLTYKNPNANVRAFRTFFPSIFFNDIFLISNDNINCYTLADQNENLIIFRETYLRRYLLETLSIVNFSSEKIF